MDKPEIIIVILVIWNVVVMGLYAFAGGAAGAMLGMYVFRHKTKHAKFRFLVPAALVIQAVLLYALFT